MTISHGETYQNGNNCSVFVFFDLIQDTETHSVWPMSTQMKVNPGINLILRLHHNVTPMI